MSTFTFLGEKDGGAVERRFKTKENISLKVVLGDAGEWSFELKWPTPFGIDSVVRKFSRIMTSPCQVILAPYSGGHRLPTEKDYYKWPLGGGIIPDGRIVTAFVKNGWHQGYNLHLDQVGHIIFLGSVLDKEWLTKFLQRTGTPEILFTAAHTVGCLEAVLSRYSGNFNDPNQAGNIVLGELGRGQG